MNLLLDLDVGRSLPDEWLLVDVQLSLNISTEDLASHGCTIRFLKEGVNHTNFIYFDTKKFHWACPIRDFGDLNWDVLFEGWKAAHKAALARLSFKPKSEAAPNSKSALSLL